MANGDHIRFEASFAKLDEAVAQFVKQLEGQLAIYKAEGDQVRAAQVQARLGALRGPVSGAGGAEQVQAATAALGREGEVLQRNLAIQLETLDALRLQVAEQRTLAEARAQLIVPPGRRYTSYGQTAGQQSAATEAQRAYDEQLANENALRERGVGLEARQLELDQARIRALTEQQALLDGLIRRSYTAYAEGAEAGMRGGVVSESSRARLAAAPPGVAKTDWTAANEQFIRSKVTLGEYEALSAHAAVQNQALGASFTRLGVQEAEASNAMRRHGALTTEYLQALARGETTVSEFGYQVGATIGKFAGWTAAAAATYTALGALVEFGKGAIDASTGVQRLTRTIEPLDRTQASTALQGLSAATNVPIKEAADAVFLYSRTFHTLGDAVLAARNGLSVFKLDNVSLQDSMRLSTSILQQFGEGATQQQTLWNMLAAGQREYNSRISETVPLLRTATGAVKNAGGDLNQLVQLAVLATRVYPGVPGQIGTAFARGAATYTPKNIKQLQEQFPGLGITDQEVRAGQPTNWTALLERAIQQSAQMDPGQRRQLANLIFDPRFGSRLAGLFGPQPAATLAAGPGAIERRITPEGTQGALQAELQKELGTTRERMHAFINEMQRMGAALADTGALSAFNFALKEMVGLGGSARSVVSAFAGLPGPLKEAVLGVELLAASLLFLSRTRFGGSIADLTRLSAIPGVGPSAATRARQDLRVGTRAAQEAVAGQVAQSSARLLTLEAQANTLGQQRARLGLDRVGADQLSQAEQEKSNELNMRILALKREETALQAERNAQLEVQSSLAAQQTGLRRGPARGGMTDAEVLALQRDVNVGTLARGAGEEEKAAGLFSRATTGIGGMLVGLKGMVASIDPFLAAMVLVPIALGEVDSAVKAADAAAKKAHDALHAPTSNLQDLQRHAAELQEASRQQARSHISGGPFGIIQNAVRGWGFILGDKSLQRMGGDPLGGAQSAGQAQQLNAIGTLYDHASRLFARDADAMVTTNAGRAKLYQISQTLKQRIGLVLQTSGLPKDEINNAYAAFTQALQDDYNKAITQGARRARPGSDFYDLLSRESGKQLQQDVQEYSDRANVYGLQGTDLAKAGQTYLYLAAKFRGSKDSTSLQLVTTAQQAFVSAVNRNVSDLEKAAESQTTYAGQAGDLNQAVSTIRDTQGKVSQWAAQMEQKYKSYPGIVKAVQDAARQIDAQLNDQLKTAIQQQLQLIKTATDLRVSQIPGASPEADIARATAALSGLREELAQARRDQADYQTIAGLMAQINDAQRALIKQQVDNARAILDARGKLAESQITGISPADDMARAQQEISNAQALLAFDQAHGAGTAKILEDQAAVFDAERQLNQQIQQRNQQLHQDLAAFIEAQGALAEARTLDPVKQARIELQTAIRVLGTIQPSDYKTYQEYQTAVMQQQAKILKDRQSLTQQIVDTQMRTLDFELHTQTITDQQYIFGLEQLLKQKKLTLEERQNILTKIYDATHQTAVDLGTSGITLPTTYEVRRMIAGARGFPGGVVNNATTNNFANNFNIVINSEADARKTVKLIEQAVRAGADAGAQAAGLV